MTFTLGSLLDQEDLGLRLVAGDASGRSRPIAGAHAIEIPHPVRWLDPHWVMLTTGVRLRHNVAAQRELVAELDRGGIAALGFAEEIIFKSVPRPIVEEAERRDFPVFAVPYRTPYRAIISFVNRSVLSNDFYVLQRSISMQNSLMDALAAERPEEGLVTRLATLLGSTVLVYAPDGRLRASQGEAPAAAIWAGVQRREASLQEFQVGRWFVVSVPVAVDDVVRYWLALATRRRSVSEQLAKPVIRSAARLLEVVARSREHAAAEERAVRSELLRRVLAAQAGDDAALADRLAAFGFEQGAACCVAAVAPAADETDVAQGRDLVEALLAEARAPYLLVDATSHMILLVHGRGSFEEWLRRIARSGVDLVAGVGRGVEALEDAGDSLRDAELALEQLRRDGGSRRVLRFEDLDLATLLISDLGLARVQPKVDALIGPVRDNEMLYSTLLAYLDADLDVGRTAGALHLHANSLRYRLAQLEERLGRPLRSPATIANLYLATMADRAARQDGANGSGTG